MAHKIICPYCGEVAKFVDSRVYYKDATKSYGMMYVCFPCDATGGAHKHGRAKDRPKGSLANAELRNLRITCHALIDPLWQNKEMSRNEVYRRIARIMKTDKKRTHIGMFREDDCRKFIELYKRGAMRNES